jgi:hypothetical protein
MAQNLEDTCPILAALGPQQTATLERGISLLLRLMDAPPGDVDVHARAVRERIADSLFASPLVAGESVAKRAVRMLRLYAASQGLNRTTRRRKPRWLRLWLLLVKAVYLPQERKYKYGHHEPANDPLRLLRRGEPRARRQD